MTEILVILVLIVLNGVFALSEMAVVSARRVRLQQWADMGDTKAEVALALANDPTRFLSTVQFGVTLIGILAGAFGGATIAERLAVVLRQVPQLAPYAGPLSLGLVVALITYLTLVIGELVPKRLALFNPERIASTVATPMRLLSLVASPIVKLLAGSTELVVRLLGAQPSGAPPITEDEINVLVNQGAEAGVFEEAEPELVRRVFRMGDLDAGAIMTPRLDISWLDLDETPEENQRRITSSVHSRFPVAHGSLDNLAGMVHTRELLARSLASGTFDLAAAMVPPVYVHERLPVLQLLERFKESRIHIALVIDEYGSVQGLVTLNDVMEAIVGELPLVGEPEDPDVVRREDGSLLLDGMLAVDEFEDILGLREELPGAERGDFQTLGGFIMTQLGRIPEAGESFDYGGWHFEVMDMDGRRVDKVLAKLVESGD